MDMQEPTPKRPRIRTKPRKVADVERRRLSVDVDEKILGRLVSAMHKQRKSKGKIVEEALAAHLKGYALRGPDDSEGEDAAAA